MAILVVNAGSTTVKFKLFSAELLEILSGVIDNTAEGVKAALKKDGNSYDWNLTEADFKNPADTILKEITGFELELIGFRVVHGGEEFREPTRITAEMLTKLEKLNDLAPLHNPPAIHVIRDFQARLAQLPMYAVFDTAFHATLPPEAYIYSIPYHFYEENKIRKYGFHGTSHKYVYNRLCELEKKVNKVITCHLGGGASITAIVNGSVLETSMGFTPLEGLTMATRSGDIDPGVVLYMARELGISIEEINNILNKQSGLLGLSGKTSDMRALLQAETTDARAALAIETYVHDIQRYIGSYMALMGGIDAIVFTAGIGQGSDVIRARILSGLESFGVKLDATANTGKVNVKSDLKISSADSVPVWVIPTNEEWQIAEEAVSLHREQLAA